MAKSKSKKAEHYELTVPIDASQVDNIGDQEAQVLKVVAKTQKGLVSKVVKLNRQGKGEAKFVFKDFPGTTTVYVGPNTVDDEQLTQTQTLSVKIPARQLKGDLRRLSPVKVSPYYWHWWLYWCRRFRIRGRVVCPDGSPVPGATVCAYDVDFFWWWFSKQQITCATTDIDGTFEMEFTWCCGYWPWWWWVNRHWRLNLPVVDRLLPHLRENFRNIPIPEPTPTPDLSVFSSFIDTQPGAPQLATEAVTASALESVREKLQAKLSVVPGLEFLWPWRPWRPWWDCTPDVVFRVTQQCGGEEEVIVDENIFQSRSNISTDLTVTLTASEEACCAVDPEIPEGNCLLIDRACWVTAQQIAGNPGAVAATPAGYARPNAVNSPWRDRPFSENVRISGVFGSLANVDYYEFEYSTDGGTSWDALPNDTTKGFNRQYWGPGLGGGPLGWHNQSFNFETKADTSSTNHNVIMSREFFEDNNDPLSWIPIVGSRTWGSSNYFTLMNWDTTPSDSPAFADGAYRLRVTAWGTNAAGDLINPTILPICETTEDNHIVLTIDNKNGSAQEPQAQLVRVKIVEKDGSRTTVLPCDEIRITPDDDRLLEIDLIAYDGAGHLAYYTLHREYELDRREPLIPTISGGGGVIAASVPSASLTPANFPVPAGILAAPRADHAGNFYDYPDSDWRAVNPTPPATGVTRPHWYGGKVTYSAKISEVFPITCAYNIELWAHKRNIVNCSNIFRDRSNFSLTVVVAP